MTTTLKYTNAGQIDKAIRSNDAYAWTGHYKVTRPYRTNGLNQYTETGPNAAPTAVFGYDANGNLTSDGTNSYGYMPENELATYAGGGTNATLTNTSDLAKHFLPYTTGCTD